MLQREAVLRAILQNGHFPLGMEFWGAADEQQWQIIKRQIDIADYYVVIIAHRYGTESEGKSWTAKKYDYAVEKGVPVLGFILRESAKWLPANIDKGINAKKLNTFKTKVKGKPVGFWENEQDLSTSIILALNKQIQSTPRVGWIRGDQAMPSSVASELARISEENHVLRTSLAALSEHDLPDVVFEVHKAIFSIQEQEGDLYTTRNWHGSLQLSLSATLRRGVPVGFNQIDTRATVLIDGAVSTECEITLSEGKSRRLRQLQISGPATFTIFGSASEIGINWDHDSHDGSILVVLRPIGYDKKFEIMIAVEADPKALENPS